MQDTASTCWEMLEAAVAGSRDARARFAQRYEPMIRAYLAARWKYPPQLYEIDDAVQEVFVECLRAGGLLDKTEPTRPGGFRAFLYGLVRNVARRFEAHKKPQNSPEIEHDAIPSDDETFSRVFDRAWAKSVMKEAGRRQRAAADASGEAAQKRVELLELRFQQDLPIREIAQRWNADPVHLHREYAKAREEFRTALKDVLASFHGVGGEALERECAELLALLS